MAKRLSAQTKEEIKNLRQKGWSLNEIKNKLGVGQGTVFRYIQDIQVLPKYKRLWFGKRGGSRKRKKLAEIEASLKARKLITFLSRKEMTIFLSALYWAEGNKKDFIFTNTDPEMIKIFVHGLEEILGISKDQIRVSIRIYEDLDKEKCLDFWSKIVGIPKNRFVNTNVLKGKKQGKLLYGMCRIRITKGANMLKYIAAVRKRISTLFVTKSQ